MGVFFVVRLFGKSGVCQSISSSISNVIGKNNLPDKSSLLQKIQIFSFY